MNATQKQEPGAKRQKAIEAVALFSVLIHARDAGEVCEAADALLGLGELGINVKFPKKRGMLKGAGHD